MKQLGPVNTLVLKKKSTLSSARQVEARQWVDLMIQAQNRKRKSLKVARTQSQEISNQQPLNLLGCFALIHTLRSMDYAERSPVGGRTDA